MSTEQTTDATLARRWRDMARLWEGRCKKANKERETWKRRSLHNLAIVEELREQNAVLLDRLSGKGGN